MDIIRAKHTSIVIPNYNMGDNEYLEKRLSIWNEDYFRRENIGFDYNEKTKELVVPRGVDVNYLEKAFNLPVDIEYKPDEYDVASFKLTGEPRDKLQVKSIGYLIGDGDFEYTKKYSQQILTLPPDGGKTYCVIAASSFLKMKYIVITHTNNVKQNWINSILKFTNTHEKFIYDIAGSYDIEKIMKSTNDLKYKIYTVNRATLNSYGKKNGWDAVEAFFKKIRVGIKVFDEAHLEFSSIMKIDLHSNTKKTFYLTATFERVNYKENTLFNFCFKNAVRYGHDIKDMSKRRHIVYLIVYFKTHPDLDAQILIKGRKGFDRNAYIDYEMKQDKFFGAMRYVLNYFKDKEGKQLILLSKTDAVDEMSQFIRDEYSDKTVGVYHSKVDDKVKDKAKEADVICSTPKSMGTGTDIPGLRINIMTEPYGAHTTFIQISGRLREYSSSQYTFYVELVDRGFKKVVELCNKRQKFAKEKCVKILKVEYEG